MFDFLLAPGSAILPPSASSPYRATLGAGTCAVFIIISRWSVGVVIIRIDVAAHCAIIEERGCVLAGKDLVDFVGGITGDYASGRALDFAGGIMRKMDLG